MRLWSLHPVYMDSKGLVALWREGLLARAVLKGKTKGYTNHPQLIRFQKQEHPIVYLDTYLNHVYLEANRRGYNFNQEKIGVEHTSKQIPVTQGQMLYEMEHLLRKLKKRDQDKYQEVKKILVQKDSPIPNPIFNVIPGDIELWEKITE
ncbi:pyrimidine dimer DNA glycosylase/endonuclease V [Methanobacterium sp.]|uniref:pyrimidine dimer DNA glycosylase/endonuclease V n=1 Tax=Methanobacterium sp. TaxID=2164 RepID=UPI002AB95404|nr:pyrimidine dimer DNA glycosylase/endonuclease V [Methanobacterium sp.]MDY9923042.1 pyrimidine dimer DNA glycosylase/endonuclease V [Methanobacterium sp.]